MTIMILAISLLVNVLLISIIYAMSLAWSDDVKKLLSECAKINNTWHDKYIKLLNEYELELDMEDDLK